MAVRGLSRLATTEQPTLENRLAKRTMCFLVCLSVCVHPAVSECVYSREEIKYPPLPFTSRNLVSGGALALQRGRQAVRGTCPAGGSP